jgi:rRNA-processing protein FCF1
MASDRLWGDRIHKTVILDSSAVMMLFEFSIDLEKELKRLLGAYNILIPTQIVKELQLLSENETGKKGMKAKASLKLIENYEIVNVDAKNGDDSILELAKKSNGVVVTNDRDLRIRLKELSIPVIFLRAKKKLALD